MTDRLEVSLERILAKLTGNAAKTHRDAQIVADEISDWLNTNGVLNEAFLKRGSHAITADEATANHADIATGLAAIAGFMVKVYRAGVDVTADGVITTSAGNLIVTDGAATLDLAEADVVQWLAF